MITSDLEATAARFGQPVDWVRFHAHGPHICVDGKNYIASCLVTDPAMESVARHYLRLSWHGSAA
jgi:hypothetical protein